MGRVSMPQGKGSQLHNRREYEKIGLLYILIDQSDVLRAFGDINVVWDRLTYLLIV